MIYSKLYVNLENLKYNLNSLRSMQSENCKVIAMIKADAYGLGINEVSKYLEQSNLVEYLGVAYLYEAVSLRKNGITLPIIILGAGLPSEVEELVSYDNIIPGISSLEYVKILNNECNKRNKVQKIHIEINTGMNRFGINPNEAFDIIAQINNMKNIEINGIYMHFSSADSDEEYTKLQQERFEKLLEKLEENNISIDVIHTSNSAASVNVRDNKCNAIRPGIMMYGYYPDPSLISKIDLKPTCKLTSTITNIFYVEGDTPIGYNQTYITKRLTKIATISIGYADGYRRSLSNKASVLIGNTKCNIIGRICMDSCMIDVTDKDDISVGDEVIIFNEYDITLDELANIDGTINYEILTNIGKRVERKYIK
ncbi:MAG: alanine racemase [Clostridia bacterium]|nr:alanine racemase [Clostridia bacterium]